MRPLLSILLFSISFLAVGQSSIESRLLTNNEWISQDLEYLRFELDTVTYNFDNIRHKLYFTTDKRKFSMEERYMQGGLDIKNEPVDFKINYISKNKLVLIRTSEAIDLDQEGYLKMNYAPFLQKKKYTFYNREYYKKNVDFKKITFLATTCFGTCPSFSLEINRDGSLFYEGRVYTGNYKGNYAGTLNKSELYTLQKLLNRSQVVAISNDWKQTSKPNDNPRYNYIIEMKDGKKYEISTNDQHPILDRLSAYFVDIPSLTKLKKSSKKHKFEKPKVNAYQIVGIE